MIRRHPEFEHFLLIKDDDFVRPPQDNQRNWILHRLLDEFSDDLRQLNELAKRFVPGSARPEIRSDNVRIASVVIAVAGRAPNVARRFATRPSAVFAVRKPRTS